MTPHNINLSDISAEYGQQVTVQDYSKRPTIDGIRLVDLRFMTDDGGNFMELVRWSAEGALQDFPEFIVRQASYSQVMPGSIKAFHLHFRQDDIWFVPPTDRLLVGLVDARAESPTSGATMRIALGGGKAQLLFIPRGVGHGVANLGVVPGAVFYFVNQQFNIDDPDERRLPWDCVGEDFWKIQPG
jgi:dTDP-4-dehydrorhamnose 3,5-epimerase-like enzyme